MVILNEISVRLPFSILIDKKVFNDMIASIVFTIDGYLILEDQTAVFVERFDK